MLWCQVRPSKRYNDYSNTRLWPGGKKTVKLPHFKTIIESKRLRSGFTLIVAIYSQAESGACCELSFVFCRDGLLDLIFMRFSNFDVL